MTSPDDGPTDVRLPGPTPNVASPKSVQWMIPTIVGWVTLVFERRGRPLLSTGETARSTPAPAR